MSKFAIFFAIAVFPLLSNAFTGQIDVANYSEKQEEGRLRIEAFRNFRYKGDYALKFELHHFAPNQKPKVYQGNLWGTWNAEGPVTRIELLPVQPNNNTAPQILHLLIHNGKHAKAYRLIENKNEKNVPVLLANQQLFEPLFEGLVYTPFDLQMSYLFWENYNYNGSQKVMGRSAYLFYLYPPQKIRSVYPDLGGINLAMDQKYNALLKADYLTPFGQPFKSIKVSSFKKVQDEYIVKQIDVVDNFTFHKTRLLVKAAAMGLSLDHQKFFFPETLSTQNIPNIPSNRYQYFR